MPRAYISGTGFHVPERVVTNDDLVKEYGIDTSDDWIQKRTGIRERRFADEGGPSDLALPAAHEALEKAGLRADQLDMILFATLSPEYAFPGSGVFLQAKLGIPGVPAMDIRNQCSGFLYAMGTATAMVESGACKNILVVGAETHSAAIDLSTSGRGVSTLFGDGAGCVVVSATEEDRGVRAWNLGADGRYIESLCQPVWDMRNRPFVALDEDGYGRIPPEQLWARMDGRSVFKKAIEKMATSLVALCWDQKIGVDDLDLVLFHQANLRINQLIQQQLGLPDDKCPHAIDRYGNTTAASIPILLGEADRKGKLKRGSKVAMIAFGSGFTWGGLIMDW